MLHSAILDEEARAVLAFSPVPLRWPGRNLPPWLEGEHDTLGGIGRYLEYTLLKPEADREMIRRLCDDAARLQLAGICVNGCWVEECAARLRRTRVRVATVVGFPLGATGTVSKAQEAGAAAAAGAVEIDMVMSLGHANSNDWTYVAQDIQAVVEAAGSAMVKVIVETAALEPLQIVKSALIARAARAGFVKTSTGFHHAGGATVEAVALLRRAVGAGMGVKASGGIRTPDTALRMLAAGASRLGISDLSCLGELIGPLAPGLADLLIRLEACR